MNLRNSTTDYGALAQAMHWGAAILMLAAFLIGEQMEDLPRGAEKVSILGVHLAVGGSVFLLALARLAWRRTDPPPPMPAGTPDWEARLAKAGHWALYALMILLPVSGFLAVTSSSRPLPLFGIVELPPLFPSRDLHEAGEEIHEALVSVLIAVVALHVAATVWHRLIRRDGVAERMFPFGRRGRDTA